MQEQPWLSILIPVYNVEPYLRECLASVLSQSLEGVEIVVVDDASTDGSSAILAEVQAATGSRLVLHRHEQNAGISATRNSLIASSQGRYLWFLDSDDLMMPGAIEGARLALQKHAPDMLLFDFRNVREPMKLKHRLRGELHIRTFDGPACVLSTDNAALLHGVLMRGHLHLWSKIFKREVLGSDLRFPVGRCFEDMALLPDMLMRCASHLYLPEVWIGYRQRPGSILSSRSLSKNDDMMLAQLDLPERLPTGLAIEARFAAAYFAARTFICGCRLAQRLGHPERLPLYLEQFQATSALPMGDLLAQYRRRGWIWRALRLSYWLRRAGAKFKR